jgi:hypothetical protein
MSRAVLLVQLCLGVLLLTGLPRSAAAAGSAVIRGATTLNVRSGPGREYPSFATLTEGSTVEVQATQGSWARVRTAAGEIGYVHKAFLVPLEPEEAAPPAEESGSEKVSGSEELDAVPATPVPEQAVEGEAAGERPAAPSDVLAGQQRLERLVESLRADVKQLADAVRERGSVAISEPAATPMRVGVTAVDATDSGSLLGLSIIGLVAGFVLGAIYGRRQERGRRTRVRF